MGVPVAVVELLGWGKRDRVAQFQADPVSGFGGVLAGLFLNSKKVLGLPFTFQAVRNSMNESLSPNHRMSQTRLGVSGFPGSRWWLHSFGSASLMPQFPGDGRPPPGRSGILVFAFVLAPASAMVLIRGLGSRAGTGAVFDIGSRPSLGSRWAFGSRRCCDAREASGSRCLNGSHDCVESRLGYGARWKRGSRSCAGARFCAGSCGCAWCPPQSGVALCFGCPCFSWPPLEEWCSCCSWVVRS